MKSISSRAWSLRATYRLGIVVLSAGAVALSFNHATYGCTIFSAIAKDGSVWMGNNEDGFPNTWQFLNVFPKTETTRFGYFTLCLDTPENGGNAFIQGGMNEAGLAYDFNALDHEYEVKNKNKKRIFPGSDSAILSHLLSNCETVQEVVDFFEVYWFERGFTRAQMHVVDKRGSFAIIGPSGTRLLTNTRFQVSTNFNICGNEDGSSCWRLPVAEKKLVQNGASLESFVDIAKNTSVEGKVSTLYSNIQNLTTGDLWFYFDRNYEMPFKTTLTDLLSKGRKSYAIRDLCHPTPLKKRD